MQNSESKNWGDVSERTRRKHDKTSAWNHHPSAFLKKNSEGSLINIKTRDEDEPIYISTGRFNKIDKWKKSKYQTNDSIEDDNYDFSQT